MFGEEKLNYMEGNVSNFEGKEMCRNGFEVAGENGIGTSGNIFITYKRRKGNKTVEDGKLYMGSTTRVKDQSANELCYKNLNRNSYSQARSTQRDLHACVNDAKGCSPDHWRNVVLEQMSQVLECKGGLRGCIQDVVAYHLQSCRTTAVKWQGSVRSCDYRSKFTSPTCPTPNTLQNGVCGNEGMVSDRPMQEPNGYTGKEICQRTFDEVIRSEKFTQLCQLLLKSFPGINSEKVLDFSFIDSKMEEGAYENSPNIFHADIQQVWSKIENIGTDMVALAKNLSAISRISFCKQSGRVSLCRTEVGKHDEPDMPAEEDRIQASDVYKVCTCKNCGEKVDAKNSLVWDLCEEMYHVACIQPAIEEIPQRSWYCASSTSDGMGSPHDDCVVCERMSAPVSLKREGPYQESKNDEGIVTDLEETYDVYKVCTCKNCGEKADATSSLVCDSCEEMYHVACIQPAIEEIPERSWYCASCTSNGMGSPHDDCVVCERLSAPMSLKREGPCQESKNDEGIVTDLEESSNDLLMEALQSNGGEDFPTCIVCRSVVGTGEKLKICPHTFCPHKFYHVRCLTSKQLRTYALQWYCPSCLCRSCLADLDDDQIVLCDGCDHAYHTYCMVPPRTSIPEGKWFCTKCEADVHRIVQAKRSYEIQYHKLKKTDGEGEGFLNSEMTEETVAETMDKKPGGVDRLINAVKTLKNEV